VNNFILAYSKSICSRIDIAPKKATFAATRSASTSHPHHYVLKINHPKQNDWLSFFLLCSAACCLKVPTSLDCSSAGLAKHQKIDEPPS